MTFTHTLGFLFAPYLWILLMNLRKLLSMPTFKSHTVTFVLNGDSPVPQACTAFSAVTVARCESNHNFQSFE